VATSADGSWLAGEEKEVSDSMEEAWTNGCDSTKGHNDEIATWERRNLRIVKCGEVRGMMRAISTPGGGKKTTKTTENLEVLGGKKLLCRKHVPRKTV